ncbi:MAG: hypothetical protein HFH72_08295 [Lachnospiraceae bacterium]|nr:hypothetical protein [Lachnospiraceae bacterium]
MCEEKDGTIVLYGASLTGQMALASYGRKKVRYFCDGDNRKVGTFVDGVEVIDKEHLLQIKDEVEVIITSNKYEEILKELADLGLHNCKIYSIKKSAYSLEEYQKLKNSVRSAMLQYFGEMPVSSFEKTYHKENKQGRKIAFVLYSHTDWIVIASLMKNAGDEHCYCIVLNHNYELMEELKAKGVEAYYAEEYRIEEDLPDIVIYDSDWYSYDGYSIAPENAKKFAKRLVLIPIDMVVYAGSNVSKLAKEYLRQNADLCFVNPDFYMKFKPYQNNLVMEGNPKFDHIYEKITGEDIKIPDEWKRKMNGKKVIMWATSHGLYDRFISPSYTFDIWVNDIMDYFRTHREYVLLFRPTPLIFQDLITAGVCNYNECRRFEKAFEAEENFIFDYTPDYGLAYKVSDALLCCPNGMLLSYLPTKKPIVYTATARMNYSFTDDKLIENYYIVRNAKELNYAIDEIFHQGDPLYKKRMETVERYVPKFDGRIGERIMKRILTL